jgi:hypothetical protein
LKINGSRGFEMTFMYYLNEARTTRPLSMLGRGSDPGFFRLLSGRQSKLWETPVTTGDIGLRIEPWVFRLRTGVKYVRWPIVAIHTRAWLLAQVVCIHCRPVVITSLSRMKLLRYLTTAGYICAVIYFMCGLFEGAVSNPDNIVSVCTMKSEQWVGKAVGGTWHGLVWGISPKRLTRLRKITKSLKMVGIWIEIRLGRLPNARKQR